MVYSAAGRAAEVSVERRHILGISRGTFAKIPVVLICHRLFLHPQSISDSSEDILQIKRYHKVPFWPFTASFCTALLPVLPDPNCFSILSRPGPFGKARRRDISPLAASGIHAPVIFTAGHKNSDGFPLDELAHFLYFIL